MMEAQARRSHYLGIGEMVMATSPYSISTVLGSCLAITVYSPKQRVGSICHAALPQCANSGKCGHGCPRSGRHVECALPVMLKKFDKLAIPEDGIEIKIFGGSDMFMQEGRKTAYPVGAMNIEAAHRYIVKTGHKIKAEDTGGAVGRKVIFDLSSGQVIVQKRGR